MPSEVGLFPFHQGSWQYPSIFTYIMYSKYMYIINYIYTIYLIIWYYIYIIYVYCIWLYCYSISFMLYGLRWLRVPTCTNCSTKSKVLTLFFPRLSAQNHCPQWQISIA
jgi:hypothetical protein